MEFGHDVNSADPSRKTGKVFADTHLHFAALVNSSSEPIICKDLTGKILSWNRAATHTFGYGEEEILGQSILQLIPPDLHREENEVLRKLRADEFIDPYETTWLKKNGRNLPVSVTVYPVRNETDRVIGASKIVCDLSDRKRNDESRFQLAAIIDSADDAIVSKDLNGSVKTWNEGAFRMFGYTAEEMIGQTMLRIIPKELQYEEDEILRKVRAGERIDHYETRRQRKNGESIDVSVTISAIRDRGAQVIGTSKIVRDISDRKRIERMLIQSEKLAARSRMAATIAHEINNPLESIINLIFLARQNSEAEGELQQYLVIAEGELERVSHIVRQALGYYKDAGAPVEVHLHELIENVLTVYNSKLLAAGILVDTQFNDLQKIAVSKGEMLQVFYNIIVNAVDAMHQDGTLKISIQRFNGSTGNGIQTVIRDSGTGIKPEHMEKIFEPFFTTKGDLGTGIGMWVAKQLVESRGGRISVSSSTEKENRGTAITIFIPFALPRSPLANDRA